MYTLGDVRREHDRLQQLAQQGALAPLFGGGGTLMAVMTPRRALYEALLVKYANAPDSLSIMNADIRSEAVLAVAANSIVWKVRVDQPNPNNAIRSSEIRLQVRDAFVADLGTVMFADELTASTKPGLAYYQQWPNPAAVNTAAGMPAPGTAIGGFGANSDGVLEAYNGTLRGTVNSVTFLQQLAMMNFWYSDQNQAGTLLFTASASAANTQAGNRGFIELTPTLDIKGKDTTEFQCTLPEQYNFAAVANHRVVAALMLRGLLVQGGSDWMAS